MPAACWNGVGRIQWTGLQARLACPYFTKAQPRRLDFTHRNQTQVNTYHLLLSSFVRFRVGVKVNSLAFTIGNFRPYLSEFVSQHVAGAVRLKAALILQQKSNANKKGKANPVYITKKKQTEKGKTPGSEQPVVKSICGSLMMRQRAASVIIIHHRMHNLQVGGH